MGGRDLETGCDFHRPRPWIAVGNCRRCNTYPLHGTSRWLGMPRVFIPAVRCSGDNIVFLLPGVEYPRPCVSTSPGTGTRRRSFVVAWLSGDWSHSLPMVREVHCDPFRDGHSPGVFLPNHWRVQYLFLQFHHF